MEEHNGKQIILHESYKKHIRNKHLKDFPNEAIFNYTLNNIQTIIDNPIATYYDEPDDSILIYSKIMNNVCLVVKIFTQKDLEIRTLYPVTEKYLDNKKREALIQKSDITRDRYGQYFYSSRDD